MWLDPLGLNKLPKFLRNKIKRIHNQTNAPQINRGISGSVSEKDALRLGRCFVGKNYRTMSNGEGWVSETGLKTFRFPKHKKGINPKTMEPYSKTGKQVNFETLIKKDGETKLISNVHLDVK